MPRPTCACGKVQANKDILITQAVETVEKVPFRKYFLKSGRETLNRDCFLVSRTTYWQHFDVFYACRGRFFRTFFESRVFRQSR